MSTLLPFVQRWRAAAIGFKFAAIMGFMLLLVMLTALTGTIALRATLGHVESVIISTTDIRELTLEIDRELQQARQLERAFFLQWPRIGFAQAMTTYAEPLEQRIQDVVVLTHRLRTLLQETPISQNLRDAVVHLDFYLSAAERYAEAFAEAVLLVSELARDGTGRQAMLFVLGDVLADRLKILDHEDLLLVLRTTQTQVNRYLTTRRQSDMQTALNLMENLEKRIRGVPGLPDVSRSELLNILFAHRLVVEEILELDRQLDEKFQEFEYRIRALLPISDQLVAMARLEVDQARDSINQTRNNATLLLFAAVLCAVLLGLTSAAVLHRSITRNLAALTNATDQLRAGNLRARARVRSRDEVGRLAETFNTMAAQIERLMHDLQQRVEMSQTRLFQGIEAIEEGFALFDKQGGLVTANRNVVGMLPPLEDILRPGISYRDCLNAVLQAEMVILGKTDMPETMLNPFSSDLPVSSGQWRNVHLEMFQQGSGMEEVLLGTDRILRIRYFRAANEETVVLLEDVTERKKLEEQRLEMERRLLHAQKLESLGVLAGGIAHDFNNLLLAMMGNMELALSQGTLREPARQRVEQGLLAAKRAADLPRQMLAYSGQGGFDVRSVMLNDLVQDNIHIFQTALAKNIRLVVNLAPSLPMIRADAGQIQQVIMNLITNASEAIGDRPGTMTLTTRLAFCDAKCAAQSRLVDKPVPGWFVWLEVQDTGDGMSPDVQAKLFDPFFSTKFTGRGLGLSAVMGIVRGHGGTIFVESAPGLGTLFQVLFPAQFPTQFPADETIAHDARPPEQPSLPSTLVDAPTAEAKPSLKPVLVAEDEQMVRELTVEALRHLGYAVVTAQDGVEALRVFQEQGGHFTCVILDLMMPNMDGVATLSDLRKIAPDVPVILCSGYSSQEVEQRLREHQPDAFLQKPFTIDALRQALQGVLGNDS